MLVAEAASRVHSPLVFYLRLLSQGAIAVLKPERLAVICRYLPVRRCTDCCDWPSLPEEAVATALAATADWTARRKRIFSLLPIEAGRYSEGTASAPASPCAISGKKMIRAATDDFFMHTDI